MLVLWLIASFLSEYLNTRHLNIDNGIEAPDSDDDEIKNFLKDIIRPIYDVIATEVKSTSSKTLYEAATPTKNTYASWLNYDDINELFWKHPRNEAIIGGQQQNRTQNRFVRLLDPFYRQQNPQGTFEFEEGLQWQWPLELANPEEPGNVD